MSGGYPITKIDINNMLEQKLPFKNTGFLRKKML
jgi:hypothetical protein